MSLQSHLSEIVGAAFERQGLDATFGAVVPSSRPELAQFQCNGAMAAAKNADKAPRDIAAAVAADLAEESTLAVVEVAGPGFINLTLTDEEIKDWTDRLRDDPRLGVPAVADPLTVVVDYAGPNVAKAMHAGHLRATIIGDSLARVFDFLGHSVIRDPHFGDWGFNMGVVIAELADRHPDWPYFDATSTGPYPTESPVTLDDLQGVYPEATSRARVDQKFREAAQQATFELQNRRPGYLALWEHMRAVSMDTQRQNFSDLGVDFDIWYGESDVADRLEPLVALLQSRGVTEESDGAVIVRVDRPDDNRDIPPLLLVNSRGGFLYSTTDLATVWHRVEDLAADLALYVVDRRQADHLLQVFRASESSGISGGMDMEHIEFGTMNGPDGKPFKTREGGIVSLSALISMVEEAAAAKLAEAGFADGYPADERATIAHQVGVGALKFGDLHANRSSNYNFDLDRFSSFEGKTGPYLQYAAVRIRSLLRKASEAGHGSGRIIEPEVAQERQLMLELLRLPEVVERTADLRAPNHVAEYAFELAGAFNRFYDVCHVLSEQDETRRASWLSLCAVTLNALVLLLDLLGIETPQRM